MEEEFRKAENYQRIVERKEKEQQKVKEREDLRSLSIEN